MRKKYSSKTSIEFSPLIIGTMRLGEWGANFSLKELEYFVDQCIDMGIKDFDHADIYGGYTEEARFGQVLKKRPELRKKIQLTTKSGIKLVSPNRPNHRIKSYNSTKEHIISSAENSLKMLGTDYLDLFLIHRPDFLMAPQELAEAFEKLKIEGKVSYFGVSNFTASQFDMLNHFTPLVTNQIEVSLLHLNAFQDGTLDQCLKYDITPTAWSPLGGGSIFSKANTPKLIRIRNKAAEIAKRHDISLDQVLLAWLYKHPSGIIPVLGSSKIDRIKKALEARKATLTHEEWYELWQASTGEEIP